MPRPSPSAEGSSVEAVLWVRLASPHGCLLAARILEGLVASLPRGGLVNQLWGLREACEGQ